MIKIVLQNVTMPVSHFLWVSLVLVLISCTSEKANLSKIVLTGNDLSTWQENL